MWIEGEKKAGEEAKRERENVRNSKEIQEEEALRVRGCAGEREPVREEKGRGNENQRNEGERKTRLVAWVDGRKTKARERERSVVVWIGSYYTMLLIGAV